MNPILEKARSNVEIINDAHREITHGTDGPVTRFVAISRAIELARSGRFAQPTPGWTDPVAEALAIALFVEDDLQEHI